MYQILLSPYSRIFYNEWKINPNRTDYHIVFDQELEGVLDVKRLRNAIKRLISEYVILNSHIEKINEELYWTKNSTVRELEYFDCNLTVIEILSYVKEPFNLEKGPLYRFGLIKNGSNSFRFITILHHILIDGLTYEFFIQELSNYYNDESYKKDIPIQNQISNLIEISEKLTKRIESHIKISKSFWQQTISDTAPLSLNFLTIVTEKDNLSTSLPIDSEKSIQKLNKVEQIRFSFNQNILSKLNKLRLDYGISPYLYSKCIYAILLNKYTGQDRFCLCYAISIKEGENFIYGTQVNTNIIPYDFSKVSNILDIIEQSREFINSLKQGDVNHSYLPIFDILSVANKDIINLAFSQTNLKDKVFEFENIKINANNHTNIDLLSELFFEQEITNEQIKYRVRYRLDKINTTLLNEFVDCYQKLFVEILDELIEINDKNRLGCLRNYNILSNKQFEQTVRIWNQTYTKSTYNKTIQTLFKEQVEQTPDSVAVKYHTNSITYKELDERTNKLGHYLQELGVESNTMIIIAIGRSLEMIIGLLGILKSGGAYVPLDLSSPEERIQFILNDVKAPIIITDRNNINKIPRTFAYVISLDEEWDTINKYSATVLPCNTSLDDLSYVIYTSGTTGNPKGVLIEHKGFVNTVLSQFQYLNIQSFLESPVSCGFFTNYAFDASVAGIFLPLISGYKLIISDELSKLEVSEINEFIYKNQIKVINCAQILTLLDRNTTSLKCLVIGGEKPDKSSVELLVNAGIKIFQEYGLTESSIVSTYKQLNLTTNLTNIGSPISNTMCYVLDINLNPMPIGAIGELYIGGLGLARGYLNRPDLTAERFIANPFQTEEEELQSKNTRLYKTGDLVRWLSDGTLEYIGRNDFQVKIRGYRLELGEIETVLSTYPGIVRSVVIAKEHSNIDGVVTGNKYLVGYYVSATKLEEDDILDYLRAKLPDYMVPTALVHIEQLPLTINGKLDRKALPDPELTNEDSYVAPRNETEKKVCAIWAEVLGLPEDKVSIHDDFFRLGGNSILAIKLVSKLNKALDNNISVSLIFNHNTIAKLTHHLKYHIGDNIVITKANVTSETDQTLSFAQERLWFIEKYEEGTSAYNTPMVFKLRSNIRLDILENSIKSIVTRHESLRTLIKQDNESNSYQLILDDKECPFNITKLKVRTQLQLDQELNRAVNYIYDLSTEYPIKVCLYSLSKADMEEEYYLSIVIHHIAFDGWSIDIFLKELYAYYNYYLEESQGVYSNLNLPELSIQYKDFAIWQRNYLSGERLDKQLAYWKDKLKGYEILNLTPDYPRPTQIDYKGRDTYFELDAAISLSLRELAKELGVSLHSLLLAGYYLMLRSYSNQDDIVVGIPIANRHYSQIENLIGLFINSLALRTKINPASLVKEFIQTIGKEVIEAQLYQDLPFEKLVEELKVAKDTSRHPIFQIMFSVQSFGIEMFSEEVNEAGKGVNTLLQSYKTEASLYNIAKFDISTLIDDSQTCLRGSFNYATSLYEETTIKRFIETYTEILRQLAALAGNKQKQEQIRVTNLSYLTEVQYKEVIQLWNQTNAKYPEDKTIHELFEEQVREIPDNIAVVYDGIELTYKELDEKVNQLAWYLRKMGVRSETLVAICLERSLELVIGILGIWKAGGAYVALDPGYPDERLRYMLADTQAPIVITISRLSKKLMCSQCITLTIDEDIKDIIKESNVAPGNIVNPYNLAYIMYTSGSTGNPKGVSNTHQGFVNRIIWTVLSYPITKKDSLLQIAAVGFDISVWEIMFPLLAGGKLVIGLADESKTPEYLVDTIIKNSISIIHFVPSLLAAFLDYSNSQKCLSIRQVICGGEAISTVLKEKFYQCLNSELYHAYGPTEAAISVTHWNCRDTQYPNNVPIGYPISNTTIYVIDENLNPVPIGAIGEIYIGGKGLARGYLNQSDLTAERFIANPFQTEEEKLKNKNARIYKTGDLGRWLPTGALEYTGRNDFQVKIRGHRIELGEIEAVLANYEGVKQSIVVAKEHKNVNGKYLVGYYIAEIKLDEESILNYLYSRLPEYMIPNVLIHVREVPLTINGKIDRTALPDHKFTSIIDYVAPRSDLEAQVCKIWAEVLGLPSDMIGIQNDFFRLGGDSIISIQLVGRIRQRLDLNVSIKDIFNYKTIKRLYDNVLSQGFSNFTDKPNLKTEQGVLTGTVPLLPIQEFFFKNKFVKANHWNQSFLLKTPNLNIKKLQESIVKLIDYHDCFRLRFKQDKEFLKNNIQYYDINAKMNQLKTLDIRELKVQEGSREFAITLQNILTKWQKGFNLEKGPTFSIGYIFGFVDGTAMIHFALHHLIIDTLSWKILVEDLKEIYEGKKLSLKGSSYRQWASAIKEYANTHESEKVYWENIMADCINNNSLDKLVVSSNTKNLVIFSLDINQTRLLLQESNRAYNTQINDLLLTSLGLALAEVTHSKVHYITLEGHGREEIDRSIDITRTVGWFTTMYPLRLEVSTGLGSSIKKIKEELRKIPNKGIGFGALIGYQLNNLPRISFNYVGQLETEDNKHHWNIMYENSGVSIDTANQDHSIININGVVVNGTLQFTINTKLDSDTTAKIAECFRNKLEEIIYHTTTQTRSYLTLSDIASGVSI